MPLSNEEIKEILAVIGESGWDEVQLTVDDVTIAVSKNGSISPRALPPAAPSPAAAAAGPADPGPAPAPSPAPAPKPAPEPVAAGEGVVASPSVGVFWRAPEPGAAPFVEVGDRVEPGQTVCIVEVMKLMQHVAAEVGGVVAAIHVENSAQVEYGTPLISIEPDA